MTQTNNLNPNTGFIICLSQNYTQFSEQMLNRFYQPILGPNAFSLYYLLKTKVRAHPMISNRQSHTLLLSWLGIDISAFQKAKERLEALRLLKSFVGHDDLGEFVVYKLLPTLPEDAFINDDLLSVLLLETIGEHEYQQLIDETTQFQFDTTKLINSSASFFESFHINQEKVENIPTVISESRTKFVVEKQPHDDIVYSKFDFQLLNSLVNSQGVSEAEIQKNKQLINTEYNVYGIDEVQMATLIVQATNVASNEIEPQKLKALISQQFTLTGNQQPTQIKPRTEVSDQTELSNSEQALVKACQQYSPADFLQQLKEQKNGYVTKNEQFILRQLAQKQLFSNEVINMLSYYLIQERGDVTLKQNLVDTVANSWSQANVATAAMAIEQIKTYQQKRTQQQTSRRSRGNQGRIKETLPKWAEENYQSDTKQASPKEIEEMKARLAKIRQKNDGQEE